MYEQRPSLVVFHLRRGLPGTFTSTASCSTDNGVTDNSRERVGNVITRESPNTQSCHLAVGARSVVDFRTNPYSRKLVRDMKMRDAPPLPQAARALA